MLCYFNFLLGDILLYMLKSLLLKVCVIYKADYFYYTQLPLCYVISIIFSNKKVKLAGKYSGYLLFSINK